MNLSADETVCALFGTDCFDFSFISGVKWSNHSYELTQKLGFFGVKLEKTPLTGGRPERGVLGSLELAEGYTNRNSQLRAFPSSCRDLGARPIILLALLSVPLRARRR